MKKLGGLIITIFTLSSFMAFSATNREYNIKENNITIKDTAVTLSEIAVVAQLKQKNNLRLEPLSSSTITLGTIEKQNIISLSDFSHYTPNLYIPEYGSKMTSSIYIRGLGSRIDHPAIGLYVDKIPLFNKNSFDSDLWDIMRLEVLRGPQSTLYGRNTIGGIINVYTLSPMVYQGTRLQASYGNVNSYSIKGSTYWKFNKWAFMVGGNYYSNDGFYKNHYDNSECDWAKGGSARARIIYNVNERLNIDNTFTFGKVNQGGYAYSLYDPKTQQMQPINYNDECGYKRTTFSNGLSINYNTPKLQLSSVTTWQYLDDKMTLDQDFTSKSMFVLTQAQHENTFTQEFVLKNNTKSKLQWLAGATLFYKHMEMDAPVTFKADGLKELILDNINNGIHHMMPNANVSFKDENSLPLNSQFVNPILGAAAYGQIEYTWKNFMFTAGLRLDYEHSSFKYNSFTSLDYKLSPIMQNYKELTSTLEGKLKRDYIEPLPKFAIQYMLPNFNNIYVSVSRGFKAGGYNTQIFSDILQNQLQVDMILDIMGNMGGMPGGGGRPQSKAGMELREFDINNIVYKPEYSWNYEIGGHFNCWDNKVKSDLALFYIDCTDQQITVFPSGDATGRMMTNAGRTRSLGGEFSLKANFTKGLELMASYGYTNAKFTKYNNGIADYKGKFLPYVPQNTVSGTAYYTFYKLGSILDKLTLSLGYNGIGKVYWNEENSVAQDFYSLLQASVYLEKGIVGLEFWGKNITDSKYYNFYFVSVGNTFLSRGKPAQWGVTLNVNF